MFEIQCILGILGLTFLLQIVFAMGVFIAARKVKSNGERVMFAPPIVWGLLTLIWGMFVVLPYWIIHHSSLRS